MLFISDGVGFVRFENQTFVISKNWLVLLIMRIEIDISRYKNKILISVMVCRIPF